MKVNKDNLKYVSKKLYDMKNNITNFTDPKKLKLFNKFS